MVKKQLMYRAAAATVLGLTLTTGVAAANPYSNHHNNNNNRGSSSMSAVVAPQANNVAAGNSSNLYSSTGSATVQHNHSGGSAGTGMADVTNTQNNAGSITNTSTPPAPTEGTDQGNTQGDPSTMSSVVIAPQVNNVTATNSTTVVAQTGNATVENNGKGGSATTGEAQVTSSQTNTLNSVSNNN